MNTEDPPPEFTGPEPEVPRKTRSLTTEDILASLNRPLPWSADAEKAVLSAWVSNSSRLDDGALRPEAFYSEVNRVLAATVIGMHAGRKAIDLLTLCDELVKQGKMDGVGGYPNVTEICTQMLNEAMYQYHRAIVVEKFQQREFIAALANGIRAFQDFGIDPEITLSETASTVRQTIADAEIEDTAPDLPHRPIGEVLGIVAEKLEERANNAGTLPGLSTGFPALDEFTGGMMDGTLWTVLAPSSEGKSTLCRQFIESVCEQGHSAVIYTYEMMDTQEASRMICSQGVVDSTVMKTGKLTRAQVEGFGSAVKKINGWDIAIVDVGGRYIEDIWRDVKRRKKKLAPGKKLVAMIDYIQLALTRQKFPKNRQQQIAYIAEGSKMCAKTTLTTLLMPSQVNKEGDPREGMDIEQSSDVMIKIRRPSEEKKSKSKKTGMMPWESGESDPLEDAERQLFLGKNRDGPKNVFVKARMIGPHFRFDEVQNYDEI